MKTALNMFALGVFLKCFWGCEAARYHPLTRKSLGEEQFSDQHPLFGVGDTSILPEVDVELNKCVLHAIKVTDEDARYISVTHVVLKLFAEFQKACIPFVGASKNLLGGKVVQEEELDVFYKSLKNYMKDFFNVKMTKVENSMNQDVSGTGWLMSELSHYICYSLYSLALPKQ